MRKLERKVIALYSCMMCLLITGCTGTTEVSETPRREDYHISTELSADAEDPNMELAQQSGQIEEVEADYTEVFENLNGCMVIYDPGVRYEIYRKDMAEERVSPYSTFKIVSVLEGLANGIIEDENSVMGYNGNWYPVEQWRQDLTLREAFESSCVWYFRKVIDAVGKEQMQSALEELHYGNCDISEWNGNGSNPLPELNGFWLDSSLKISPREQTEILAVIFEGETDYDENDIQILKDIMLVGTEGETSFYGKTGSGQGGKAWFAGFAEQNDKRIYFSVYLDDEQDFEAVDGKRAKEIALEIMRTIVQ